MTRQERIEAARNAALQGFSAINLKPSSAVDWPEYVDSNDKASALRQLREEGRIIMQGKKRGARYLLADGTEQASVESTDDPLLDFIVSLPDGLVGQRLAQPPIVLSQRWAAASGKDLAEAHADIVGACRGGLLQTERRQLNRPGFVGHYQVAWPA